MGSREGVDGKQIGLSRSFHSGLGVLGIALEKKGADILDKDAGEMPGYHMENRLEAHDLQVSTSGVFLLADSGTGFSDLQSQGATIKGKTKTPAHESTPVSCLPCLWLDTISMASGCSAEESYKKHPVFPAKQMWL